MVKWCLAALGIEVLDHEIQLISVLDDYAEKIVHCKGVFGSLADCFLDEVINQNG